MEPINLYLKELKNEHSTKEESIELFIKAKGGDTKAKDRLLSNYLLLVVKIARTYANKGVSLCDLIAEGNIGLLNAFEKYDPEKGPFSTCARIWIKQAIIRNCMHNNRIVRLPENISELMRTGRWEGALYGEVSIDTPNHEGDSMAEDLPSPSFEENIFQNEEEEKNKSTIKSLLKFLKHRDAEIVKAFYGIDREEPLEILEIAELFNLTTTRINQILRNSLKEMRISQEKTSECETVTIISAEYGQDETYVNVTDKVVDLYIDREIIKSSNKLGGDPCPGIKKQLIVKFILGSEILTKSFPEGSTVKF